MSKTVKIPNNMSPWEATVNGVHYSYPAGSTQTAPDAVAELIDRQSAADVKEPKRHWNEVPVSSVDNGKVLKVVDGKWHTGDDDNERLPTVAAADNGKVLKVVDGKWAAADTE